MSFDVDMEEFVTLQEKCNDLQDKLTQVLNWLRCETTKNLCGTDTHIVGYDCKCPPCRIWLKEFKNV